MKQMIAGNWKMNGSLASVLPFAAALGQGIDGVQLLICPPFPLIGALVSALTESGVGVGAQDCAMARAGAHTGDVSPVLLAEMGATHVILGHSERRADHGETSALVHDKAEAAMRAGLIPIICVGETLAQREAGDAETVVRAQLARSVPEGFGGLIAYEPVWAIGTGKSATEADVGAMHGTIRAALKKQVREAGETMRILYGGSVKPGNAAGLLAVDEVGGALVGGASLDGADFMAIARAAVGVG